MRVSLRQLFDLVGRLLWCLQVPKGLRQSATRIVVGAELEDATGLMTLEAALQSWSAVDLEQLTPGDGSSAVKLDAGGQSLLVAGPLAVGLVLEKLRSASTAIVEITDVELGELSAGLARELEHRSGATATVLTLPQTSARGVAFALDRDVPARPWDLDRLLVEGIHVDPALWTRLFERSLNVLLDVERIPDPQDARL
jgi:hypothetical protein